MRFNSKTYDILKWVTQVVLPALGTLYFTLASIWGLPKADEVVGTIMALVLFLGVLLGISNSSYKRSDERFDGALHVYDMDEETKGVRMVMDNDISEIQDKSELNIRIKNAPPPE